jgi:phospholipase D1/2
MQSYVQGMSLKVAAGCVCVAVGSYFLLEDMPLRSPPAWFWCLLAVCVGVMAVWTRYYLSGGVAVEERYRFGSFAPVRNGSGQVKWLVDGQRYMSAVADAIMSAEHEILITDWQMNPHIFMKRPETGITSLEWRLDKMLLRKAESGVRVYILLYWETKAVMDLGSSIVQSVLQHDNIIVQRHPTHSTPMTNPETILRWSHHEKIVVVDRKIAFVGGIDLCFGRWDTHSHDLNDNYPLHPCVLSEEPECVHPSTEESGKRYRRWIGKDYGNTLLGVVRTKLDEPFKDYINRKEDPRMPWHDVACSFNGDPVMDIVKHFIERYNAIQYSPWWRFWDRPQLSVEDWAHPKAHSSISDASSSNVDIQVLRSVGDWSAVQPSENSIHQAYIHAIEEAEHFIYIENQFFISSQSKKNVREVYNEIQQALCNRIARAYVEGEAFHVFIILPLQPEFPDEFGSGGAKDSVSYWNYATLYNGEDSLYEKLKKHVPEKYLHRYFSVYSLRTHDFLNDRFVTEIVYVHSKVIIVDDRLAIIGSANINDRSMLGERDSEVDVLIEDRDMIEGEMNGEPYDVGKFSHGLRCHLMNEHLGLLNKPEGLGFDVEDPMVDNFFSKLHEVASNNTKIYETVFSREIIPTNPSWTFEDMEEWRAQGHEGFAKMYPEQVKDKLSKVQGNIVLFPPLHKYLQRALKPSILDRFDIFVDNRDFNNRETVYS